MTSWTRRGLESGSTPLQSRPGAPGFSIGVCWAGGEVYDLYGGGHRAERRRRVAGADILCISASHDEQGPNGLIRAFAFEPQRLPLLFGCLLDGG